MKIMHSVSMELLRHGPPHNQLLSPLTQYLAISGKHEPVTLNVDYEHIDFMSKLKSLRYGDVTKKGERDNETRRFNLQTMSRDMAHIFAAVPGVISEIHNRDCESADLTHLRLIISPSELSLLPYEMGNSPSGFPGEGRALSLQSDHPIVMTREVRGAKGYELNWVREPKILFAYAGPNGMSVPAKAHLQALRNALAPWLKPPEDGMSPREQIEQYLHVIPNATIDKITTACEQYDYSYIHILAHGMATRTRRGDYGVALYDGQGNNDIDVVNGPRLVAALRVRNNKNVLSNPLVVTLATCDSGAQSDVQWPGSSLAHTLHEEGVPLVIASQFPLSKKGSVTLTELLYDGLMWGEDPRILLHRIRQRLFTKDLSTHDWASLVAYASLPDNFTEQLKLLKLKRSKNAMRFTIDRADYSLDQNLKSSKENSENVGKNNRISNAQDDEHLVQLRTAIKKLPDADVEFDIKAQHTLRQRVEHLAFLAGANKRMSYFLHSKGLIEGSIELLKEATALYKRAYDLYPMVAWVGIQYLIFSTYLRYRSEKKHQFDLQLWQELEWQALKNRKSENEDDKHHANANLLQLYFLAQLPDMREAMTKRFKSSDEANKKARSCAQALVDGLGKNHFVVRSTRRQFERLESTWSFGGEGKLLITKVNEYLSE